MKEETDAILKAFGDTLLHLACDTSWLVPNTSVNPKQLNSSIAAYQQLLDTMELEISMAIEKARAEELKPEPEPEAMKTEEKSPQKEEFFEQAEPEPTNFDNLDSKYSESLGNDIGDEIDFYDMNSADNLGMFGGVGGMSGDSKLDDGYGMIDDQYF